MKNFKETHFFFIMSNQVHLSPTKLSILSIPRDKVWLFTSPLLRLLREESLRGSSESDLEEENENLSEELSSDDSDLSEFSSDTSTTDNDGKREGRPHQRSDNAVDNSSKAYTSLNVSDTDGSDDEDDEAVFFHIAFTPTECTAICPSSVFRRVFSEVLETCQRLNYKDVVVVEEPFINLQVDSDGESNNSSRILELTRPLSENGIPLFFLSSHFTDVVLIPHKVRNEVVEILTNNSFEFSDISNSYIATGETQLGQEKEEVQISSPELENRTLKLFKDNGIHPKISKLHKLLLTGARPGSVKEALQKAAMCIGSGYLPNYFVMTRTSLNELSLVLPGSSRKRAAMGFDFKSIIGSAQDVILPIAIDLRSLPTDLTGIVAGLASRILSSCEASIEMSYLSMARSGVVMIPEEDFATVARVVDSTYSNTKSVEPEE